MCSCHWCSYSLHHLIINSSPYLLTLFTICSNVTYYEWEFTRMRKDTSSWTRTNNVIFLRLTSLEYSLVNSANIQRNTHITWYLIFYLQLYISNLHNEKHLSPNDFFLFAFYFKNRLNSVSNGHNMYNFRTVFCIQVVTKNAAFKFMCSHVYR